MVEHLSSMYKVLDSIPITPEKRGQFKLLTGKKLSSNYICTKANKHPIKHWQVHSDEVTNYFVHKHNKNVCDSHRVDLTRYGLKKKTMKRGWKRNHVIRRRF